MSNLQNSGKEPQDSVDEQSNGPNLTIFYVLIALALLAAIAIAALIVFPFYIRR